MFDRVVGLAIVGLVVMVPAGALFGEVAMTVVAAVFLGPFLLFGVVFVFAFALSLIVHGEPDHYVERWFRW